MVVFIAWAVLWNVSPQYPALELAHMQTRQQSGCNWSWEICLASNRCSVLHYNKVLSAGNLISSDVANALCQKRLRLMLAWSPLSEKAGEREESSSPPHPPASYAYTTASQSGGSDLHATPTSWGVGVLSGLIVGVCWSSPCLLVQ